MPGARRRTADRDAHGLGIAADHHAVTALQAPDAAGSADVDVVQAFFGEGLGAANVVLIVGVAAVDDGVAGFEQSLRVLMVSSVGAPAGSMTQTARGLARPATRAGKSATPGGALAQGVDEGGIAVVNNGGVPVEHQAPRNIAAHAAQSNNPELHVLMLLTTNKSVSLVIAQRD
jgi:hypothetical protein